MGKVNESSKYYSSITIHELYALKFANFEKGDDFNNYKSVHFDFSNNQRKIKY